MIQDVVKEYAEALADTKPPTLRSVDVPVIVEQGPGRKDDTGKVRTDLLPMGALACANEALLACPVATDQPWPVLFDELVTWRRGERKSSFALSAACLLVLLTREIRGDVRVTRVFPDCGPALAAVAKVLTFGASKYGPNNWQRLENFYERYYAAILRHLFAVEKIDSESGLPHLAHAACGALFLLSAEIGHDP